MHPLDLLAGLLYRLPSRRTVVFPDGWGDEEGLALFDAAFGPEPPPAQIEWGRKEEHRRFRRRRGWFTSPVADRLPTAARAVPVEEILPAQGAVRHVVMLPAWNDHGFEERRKLAVLLAERGIGARSFDIPFYGTRRTTPAGSQAIRTVADFARMGHGAVQEARALLAGLDEPSVGVTGYSMGGNLAALTAAATTRPMAVAAIAASHSPAPVYLDGVLSGAIAWGALGGRAAAPELRATLAKATATAVAPLPHLRAAVVVAATGDGFVPAASSQVLADHWGVDLHTIRAGHATLLWRRREDLADLVVEAFDRFEAREGRFAQE
jgi:dienelactone hydrolase